jgi:hypothetical protein
LPPQGKVNLMAGERELTTGLLAKHASFRLIVTGSIGVKENERLNSEVRNRQGNPSRPKREKRREGCVQMQEAAN